MKKLIYFIRHAEVEKANIKENEPILLSDKGKEWSQQLPNLINSRPSLLLFDEVEKNDSKYNRCEETLIHFKENKRQFNKRQLNKEITDFLDSETSDLSMLICFRSESFGKIHSILKPDYHALNTENHKIFVYEASNIENLLFLECIQYNCE